MKKAVILFTRVPIPGQTKTRMQKAYSSKACAKLHGAILKDLRQMLAGGEWDVFVHYTPANQLELLLPYLWKGAVCEPQTEEPLGLRMSHSINNVLRKGYEACVLIGSDIPEITKEDLHQAFSVLKKKDIVLAGTHDHGYCLIGMKQPEERIFSLSRYGSGEVLNDTIDAIEACGLSYGMIRTMRDLDEPEDLETWYEDALESRKEVSNTFDYIRKLKEDGDE